MKSEIPSVETLNDIQRQWMATPVSATKEEISRISKLMEQYPRVHVSIHKDGTAVCMAQGMPCSIPVTLGQAMAKCASLKGRMDIVWNGDKGEWQLA